ncbi:MAG: NAD(P)H-dependent oxidoreductase [Rhizobium sp.]|nr:NAD(P)H-dependent oxidoreductase [Rhizobium sp.]
MSTLLQINTSLFSDSGASTRLATGFAQSWLEENPTGRAIVRDLATPPVPHLDAERFDALRSHLHSHSDAQAAAIRYSNALIEELFAADVVAIGMPMYNFGVPSTFKAYLDHVARPGLTFRYTASGPVGLLTGKKAFVFCTRGGAYAGTPLDTQTAYLRLVLGFLGIEDVRFIYAEGLARGEAQKEKALADAAALATRLARIGELAEQV